MVTVHHLQREVDSVRSAFLARLDPETRFMFDYLTTMTKLLDRHRDQLRQVDIVTVDSGGGLSAWEVKTSVDYNNGRGTRRGSTRQQIASLMADGEVHRVTNLAQSMGKSVTATSAALRSMRDLGMVDYLGKKRGYRLTPKGANQVPAHEPGELVSLLGPGTRE